MEARGKVIQCMVVIIILYFSQTFHAQQTISGSILHKGINRTYRLRLPTGHSNTEPIPLVLNMHGLTSNATQQELYSGMNSVADTARFAVCYPNGIATSWNVGWTFGSTADDVGFISVLIYDLVSKYSFDKTRIYACGMSNGGFMSFRLACELSGKIAAIASVTGSVVPGRLQLCNPDRAVPVLAIHGTEDDVVPYNGGIISLPIEQVINFWRTHNECTSDSNIFKFPDINTNDNSTAIRYSYNECNEDSAVELIRIIGGGHTWPGSVINNGIVNRDLNASVEIWRFFRRFSLNQISSSFDSYTDASTVKIYPNPSNNIIYLEGVKSHQNISITDINGKIFMIPDGGEYISIHKISIEHFNQGLYFVRLSSESSTKILKFVKI